MPVNVPVLYITRPSQRVLIRRIPVNETAGTRCARLMQEGVRFELTVQASDRASLVALALEGHVLARRSSRGDLAQITDLLEDLIGEAYGQVNRRPV